MHDRTLSRMRRVQTVCHSPHQIPHFFWLKPFGPKHVLEAGMHPLENEVEYPVRVAELRRLRDLALIQKSTHVRVTQNPAALDLVLKVASPLLQVVRG